MKAGRAHRVPLCDRAVEILKRLHELRRSSAEDALIFEGRPGRPTSDMTMTQHLRRDGIEIPWTGFRSRLRDWDAEAPGFPRALATKSLAPQLTTHDTAANQSGAHI